MCKTIKQKVKFKASAKTVYDLLTNSQKHSRFTRHKAVIGKKAGDSFSAYDGYIKGINVELVPGKRIVQAWRGSDFPPGIFSMATFNLTPTKDGGTELVLTHPKNLIPGIEKGWKTSYWERMKEYLLDI
jgi:uncharacterized protein YndB with AHSA1/START domain